MFKRRRYPDGQIAAEWEGPWAAAPDYTIRERINSYEDLFYIRSIGDVIGHNMLKGWQLFIPCMFGQRSDRRFTQFQSFDLRLIADTINECNFDKVIIFDPHSDMTLGLINRSEKLSPFEYVKKTVGLLPWSDKPVVLVSPDAGAYKKVFEFGEKLNLPVMAAVKHRGLDGKVNLTFTGGVTHRSCLIVDDLCDGGYTFEVLTKALKEHGASNVYLYVSHGLFSKGFASLFEAGIDHVYCTNSIKDVPTDFSIPRTHDDLINYSHVSNYITQYKII
jgi:ribose-phosphate pyrophosphokinase